MPATTRRLKNLSTHLKYINVGGGSLVCIPPTNSGPGIEIRFETDAEVAAFDKAIAAAPVQAWFAAGELVLDATVYPIPGQAPPAAVAPTQVTHFGQTGSYPLRRR